MHRSKQSKLVAVVLAASLLGSVTVAAHDTKQVDVGVTAPSTPGPSPGQIQAADQAAQQFQGMAPRQYVPQPGMPIPRAYVYDPYYAYPRPAYPQYYGYPGYGYPGYGWGVPPGYGPPVATPYPVWPPGYGFRASPGFNFWGHPSGGFKGGPGHKPPHGKDNKGPKK